ncbi:putative deacetylase LmbE-like domain-containing protein [Endogone sp. FLAS-F59071]|nr:putative deacetylase LmbE-like domain-containing protein [Endogone sp. FLAS-F59071]|eukprot:RUS15635.1 putative deacetylase LmbE-like domain-containing protein [Endogone sp. FLAS-F59071]
MLAVILTTIASISLFTYILHLFTPSSSLIIDSRILVLTAHPDDECMFFAPTLLKLTQKKNRNEVFGLCLSTVFQLVLQHLCLSFDSVGNFDGLGHLRKHELTKSYETLGVDSSHVTVLDHPELQDGMKNNWKDALITEIVKSFAEKNEINVYRKAGTIPIYVVYRILFKIITFDNYGVSGHPNHIACFNGISYLHTKVESTLRLRTYNLTSVPLLRKFIALFDLPVTIILRLFPTFSKDVLYVSAPSEYLAAHRAMRHHHTQLVWFRWLYVMFSRYMYINELRRNV